MGSIMKTLFFVVLLLVFPIEAFCSSPRLLITLGPGCDFAPEALQEEIGCLVVSAPGSELRETILSLDRSQSTHIIVYTYQIDNLEAFARVIGYESVMLNNSLKESLCELRRLIPTIPCTDADLPRMDPHDVGRFYDLLMKVDHLFKKAGISYWATTGTLLGAVRHRGVIPWDDDIDIAICAEDIPSLKALQGALSEEGLGMAYYSEAKFYKIFPLNGDLIQKDGGVYEWKYPFIDIFPLICAGGKRRYMYEVWREKYKNDFFYEKDLCFPLARIPFGPTTIPVPKRSVDYVKRAYDEDWNTVTYVHFDHKNERYRKKIRVDLVDRSAPHYILPDSAQ